MNNVTPAGSCAGHGLDVHIAIPDALFEHRPLLYTRDHRPFSEVHEISQQELLAFPVPVQ